MKIKQLNVFLENKQGRLANIVNTLGERNVNIKAISLSDTTNFGILRMIVDDTESAKQSLKARGFTVSLTDVFAVRIDDKPGELAKLLTIFETDALNLEYIYGLSDHSLEHAVIIVRFDDMEKAQGTFEGNNIRLLQEKEVLRT